MLFAKRINAIALVPIGMLFLILALVWPRLLPVATALGPDWNDALRGFLFGLSIGLNLVAVFLLARQRRSARA
jgi:hypothetical protein